MVSVPLLLQLPRRRRTRGHLLLQLLRPRRRRPPCRRHTLQLGGPSVARVSWRPCSQTRATQRSCQAATGVTANCANRRGTRTGTWASSAPPRLGNASSPRLALQGGTATRGRASRRTRSLAAGQLHRKSAQLRRRQPKLRDRGGRWRGRRVSPRRRLRRGTGGRASCRMRSVQGWKPWLKQLQRKRSLARSCLRGAALTGTGLAEAQGCATGLRVVALASMACGVRGEARITATSSRKLCRSFCLRLFVVTWGARTHRQRSARVQLPST